MVTSLPQALPVTIFEWLAVFLRQFPVAAHALPQVLGQCLYRRQEIDYLVQNEMIIRLEDYLRRRSKIELLMPREELRQSKGLREACEKFFSDEAQQRLNEYFD